VAVLLTGGAGYIGATSAHDLIARGERVVVLDSLIHGHRDAVPGEARFYPGDIADEELVRHIVDSERIDACLHFAAFIEVGESVKKPGLFFENNFSKGLRLIETLRRAGVRRFVFSSTAAVYGLPQYSPIGEAHPRAPINPYGWSKLALEAALEGIGQAHDFHWVALRYFNAAGAGPHVPERHNPETHLIPNVLRATAGLIPALKIFGTDYDTPDGTAIRDYVHVLDLADAHHRALEHLRAGGASQALNLGTGAGASILEVLETARRVTGKDAPHEFAPRRPGDATRLVADARRAQEVLGWQPRHSSLENIVRTAWEWISGSRAMPSPRDSHPAREPGLPSPTPLQTGSAVSRR
jgi:UDP-glucose 4-epimerase